MGGKCAKENAEDRYYVAYLFAAFLCVQVSSLTYRISQYPGTGLTDQVMMMMADDDDNDDDDVYDD